MGSSLPSNRNTKLVVVMEYLVKLDLKACILEFKRRYFEDYCSDNQYAVSIMEDTTYMCLHSPKTTKKTSSIRQHTYQNLSIEEDTIISHELISNAYHGTIDEDIVDYITKKQCEPWPSPREVEECLHKKSKVDPKPPSIPWSMMNEGAKDTLGITFGEDPVMSSSSIVTYTSVYTDFQPGRVFWGADEEMSDGGSPQVIVYGYDGLPMQPVAPPSPDYVPGPEHPLCPDYVPDPEHPPSPVEALWQTPIRARIRKDPEEDHADYPADGGDDNDDEPSDDDHDDDDTDDEDEKPFEDENYDEEEDEHLALADSSTVPVVDHVPSAGDTEAFKTDESAPTPRSPQTMVPFA
ncbi:hypothetical protein Tco_0237335 [Tanacetum coccineum]